MSGAASRGPLLVRARATHNARLVNGQVVYEGDVVVVDTDEPDAPLFGDTVRYELLCRRHYRSGELADDGGRDRRGPPNGGPISRRTGHPLDAVDEVALQVRRLARDLQTGQAVVDLLEHHGELTPGQVRPRQKWGPPAP